MVSKKKLAAATFGAALTSMYVAPNLEADILNLTFSQTYIGNSVLGTFVNMNEVGAGFLAWNGGTNAITSAGSLASLGVVQYSQTLTTGNTFPISNSGSFTNVPTSTGTAYIGFKSFAGNVGWFKVEILNTGGMVIGPGAYGSMGEAVHVGTVIPEPTGLGALAMLALGAVGVRRNRKK